MGRFQAKISCFGKVVTTRHYNIKPDKWQGEG